MVNSLHFVGFRATEISQEMKVLFVRHFELPGTDVFMKIQLLSRLIFVAGMVG